jgi:hypothetical protein
MPSDRQSLQGLKNIIEQVELLISTAEFMPETERRNARSCYGPHAL